MSESYKMKIAGLDRKLPLCPLNEKLQIIKENIGTDVTVFITYFVPDEKKSGGTYASCTGSVKRMDAYEHRIIMNDNTVIPIEQIYEVESDLFE